MSISITPTQYYQEITGGVFDTWNNINLSMLLYSTRSESAPTYDFLMGPPFVSGTPHHGHGCVSMIKDTIAWSKYKEGYTIKQKTGYDCHGLPIESKVMSEMNLKTNQEIIEIGVGKFNQACKDYIHRYSSEHWVNFYENIGYRADFVNHYKTMDKSFMESVWWIFKNLHEKNLVYQGFKVMPYSCGCETPLSNFEAGQNYKESQCNSLYVKFKITSGPYTNSYMVAWTTTPWTLPSNVALCVNPDSEYISCEAKNGEKYIVAEGFEKNLGIEVKTTKIGKGQSLINTSYEHLFDYFSNLENSSKYYKILADSFVITTDTKIGTGVVHIAPAFGEEDSNVCIKNGIVSSKTLGELCPVNSTGGYSSLIYDMVGENVFLIDKTITKKLKDRNMIVKSQNYTHQYPYCYRTDTPLMYRAVSSYFVRVTELKDRMIALNKTVNWTRKDIGENRFGNWLEQAKDWSISRNRYFGTPLPVWKTQDGTETLIIGSIEELCTYANIDTSLITDLHSDYIDDLVITSETGKRMYRVKEVFDCWFESGSVPFAQIHYPFENANYFDDKEYLSDFVVEGLDQTRGWFYTLLVISTAILNKAPYKTVMCSGLVLDENGDKMSKKLGNYTNPNEIINKYGADALRIYFLNSGIVSSEPLKFKETNISDINRMIIPLINGTKYFVDYAIIAESKNIKIKYIDENYAIDNLTDKWILEQITNFTKTTISNMNNYNLSVVAYRTTEFIDTITNWYIKFNRNRMKGGCGENEQFMSLSVLYTVLYDYITTISYIIPFLSEYLFKYLNQYKDEKYSSVHLTPYPKTNFNFNMTNKFKTLISLISSIRTARLNTVNHKSVKVAIKKCTFYNQNIDYIDEIKEIVEILKDEINCLEFDFDVLNEDQITYSVLPNKKNVGIMFKKTAKQVATFIEKMSLTEITTLVKTQSIDSEFGKITIDCVNLTKNITCNSENEEIVVKIDEDTVLKIDFAYDDSVKELYIVRQLIKEVQNLRKCNNLRGTDKINVEYFGSDDTTKYVKDILMKNSDYIVKKLLCNDFKECIEPDNDNYHKSYSVPIEIDNTSIVLIIGMV